MRACCLGESSRYARAGQGELGRNERTSGGAGLPWHGTASHRIALSTRNTSCLTRKAVCTRRRCWTGLVPTAPLDLHAYLQYSTVHSIYV